MLLLTIEKYMEDIGMLNKLAIIFQMLRYSNNKNGITVYCVHQSPLFDGRTD